MQWHNRGTTSLYCWAYAVARYPDSSWSRWIADFSARTSQRVIADVSMQCTDECNETLCMDLLHYHDDVDRKTALATGIPSWDGEGEPSGTPFMLLPMGDDLLISRANGTSQRYVVRGPGYAIKLKHTGSYGCEYGQPTMSLWRSCSKPRPGCVEILQY
eukprot:2473502-Rhodomonas_salina.1